MPFPKKQDYNIVSVVFIFRAETLSRELPFSSNSLNIVWFELEDLFELSKNSDTLVYWGIQEMNFYSWGEHTELQNHEIRSRETEGWVYVYPSSTNHSVAHIIKTLKYILFSQCSCLRFFEFYFRLKNFLTTCGEAILECRILIFRRAQTYPTHSP